MCSEEIRLLMKKIRFPKRTEVFTKSRYLSYIWHKLKGIGDLKYRPWV